MAIRNRTLRVTQILAAAAGAALAMTSSAFAVVQPSFRIIDLGTLGGTQSEALGLNDAGQVSGHEEVVAMLDDVDVGPEHRPRSRALALERLLLALLEIGSGFRRHVSS